VRTRAAARSTILSALLAAGAFHAPAPAITSAVPAQPSAPVSPAAEPRKIDWATLLPADERANHTEAPPPAVHDYLGEGSLAALQTGSVAVNAELNGVRVSVPGFVVPLEMSTDGLVSEFFLVPYFGACIHVPPPPPNQIVYVRMQAGVGLKSIEDAVWITGTIHAASKKSALGSAVYTLDGEKLEPYQYSRP
jgi:uncharacterized protein